MAIVWGCLSAVAACASAPAATPDDWSDPPAAVAAGARPLPPLASVRPVGLSIPAIGVEESSFERLSLGKAGKLDPPTDFRRVGWFVRGPVPGDPGPAVIAGHVDSRFGPAVFFRLHDLKPGDAVTVRRSDGHQVGFTVDSVQRYPKASFPTAAVYGQAPGSALRLITCGGIFDAAKDSYRENIVVYASTKWTDSQ